VITQYKERHFLPDLKVRLSMPNIMDSKQTAQAGYLDG